ncbi:MAG: ROK family protein [Gemmatimonadetes bacterium]|nr:ROK family protein [Gemmatimonadota bacterium]
MNYIVGIDIGGTNLVLGTVSEDGSVLHGLRKEPTRAEEGPDAVVARLVGLSRQAIEDTLAADPEANFIGVGIGSPGPLDRVTGRVLITPNLGWTDFPLRDAIRDALALPTALDNDANCAVLGEWWRGAARDTRHAIGITVGTGIGGGIIIDGKLYHGFSEVAGELGHTTIDANGRLCKCGNYGCLEAYAAGPAIARRAVEALRAGVDSSLPDYVSGKLEELSAAIVYQAARDGDQLALEVVRETSRLLGIGIANLVNIFNPEVVVVCGGVTMAGDGLFDPLRQEVRRRAFRPAAEACRIIPGELTGTAGVYGAVRAFLDQRDDGLISGTDDA